MMSGAVGKDLSRGFALLVLTGIVLSGVAWGILTVTIPVDPVPINIRWAPSLAASDRHVLENRWRLAEPEHKDGTTWLYALFDYSRSNIEAIVKDPNVLDTAHVNRTLFVPDDQPTRPREIQRAIALFAGVGAILLLALGPFTDLRRFWIAFGVLSASLYAVASFGILKPQHPLPVLCAALFVAVLGAIPCRIPLPDKALLIGVAAAPVLFVAVTGIILAMALFGYQPLWRPGPDVTLVEAAYHTDRATVARMIDRGADPNAPGPVLDDDRRLVLTPLEAAIISRDLELVQILVSRGAVVDASNRRRLACLAREAGDDSIVRYIQGPTDSGNPMCDGIVLPQH
jgi:hypothetical protein